MQGDRCCGIPAPATLVLVNVLDLESISTTGSVGFLLIFGIVNFTGYKLSQRINGNKYIPLAGLALCITALLVLVRQQYDTNLIGIIMSAGIIGFCFLSEWIFKKSENHKKRER